MTDIKSVPDGQELTTNALFGKDNVKKRFGELLGKRAPGFITSVLQTVQSNGLLSDASPQTVLNAAATAASLDLPVNPSLGFSYIIPYNNKQKDGSYKVVATFQIGYKGLIQLAQRSGRFKTINVSDVKEGEIKHVNRLTGEFDFDWKVDGRDKLKTIGYVAYFELINGFSKTYFMSSDEVKAHGKKYSQTFKRGAGLWKDEFDTMAQKTVLKLLLSKYAPLSIQMEKAQLADQSVQYHEGEYEYPDNQLTTIDITEQSKRVEEERVLKHINSAKDVKILQVIENDLTDTGRMNEDYLKAIEAKKGELIDKAMADEK